MNSDIPLQPSDAFESAGQDPSSTFYGQQLLSIQSLQTLIRDREGLPVEVRLLDARVYPDHHVALVLQARRSRGSMNVRRFIDKYRRLYPGLDFRVPAHGRTRLDTVRRSR